MHIDQLRNWFPDETACRQFFENARWPNGRVCPHCGHDVSYIINASHRRVTHFINAKAANASLRLPPERYFTAPN